MNKPSLVTPLRISLMVCLFLGSVGWCRGARKDFQTGTLVDITADQQVKKGNSTEYAIYQVQIGDLVYFGRGKTAEASRRCWTRPDRWRPRAGRHRRKRYDSPAPRRQGDQNPDRQAPKGRPQAVSDGFAFRRGESKAPKSPRRTVWCLLDRSFLPSISSLLKSVNLRPTSRASVIRQP